IPTRRVTDRDVRAAIEPALQPAGRRAPERDLQHDPYLLAEHAELADHRAQAGEYRLGLRRVRSRGRGGSAAVDGDLPSEEMAAPLCCQHYRSDARIAGQLGDLLREPLTAWIVGAGDARNRRVAADGGE